MLKMLLRGLKKNLIQTVGIILMGMLWMTIASFVANMFAHSLSFQKSYYEETNVEDFNFIPNKDNLDKIIQLSEKYKFTYELRNSVDFSENGISYRAILNNNNIDKPYIVDGKNVVDDSSVMVNQEYAKENKIKPGSMASIQGKNYVISGVFTTPDYLKMHIRDSLSSYDAKNEALLLVSSRVISNLSGEKNLQYVGKFKNNISDSEKKTLIKTMSLSSDFSKLVFKEDNSNISILSAKSFTYKIFTYISVGLLSNIAGLLIILFIYTNVKENKKQIGILKANGFNNGQIFFSYWVIALLLILPAAVVGYFAGNELAPYISKMLQLDLSIPESKYTFNFMIFAAFVIFNFYIALIASLLGVVSVFRESVIELMKVKNIKQITTFEKAIFKIYRPRNFKNKLKLSFAIRSKLLLFLVTFSTFAAGVQFYMTYIIYQLPDTVQEVQSDNMNYENEVHTFVMNKKMQIPGQYFYQTSGIISNDKSDTTAQIIGIDEGDLIKLKSQDSLSKNGAVVNATVAKILNLKVGSNLKLEVGDKTINVSVTEVSSRLLGKEVFVNHAYLVKQQVIEDKYTGFYTKEKSISQSDNTSIINIISKQQVLDNLQSTKNIMHSGSVLLFILGIFVPVIILIVAVSFLVSNNKNEIRILQLNGFSKNEISKLIYRAYDFFVVIGLILSIPYVYFILGLIFKYTTQSSGIAYPININFLTILFGIIMTCLVYFTTLIILSRKDNNIREGGARFTKIDSVKPISVRQYNE